MLRQVVGNLNPSGMLRNSNADVSWKLMLLVSDVYLENCGFSGAPWWCSG